MSVTYCGTIYRTIELAARAYAETALPDLEVVGLQGPRTFARELEAYCHRQEAAIGVDLPKQDGRDVDIRTWRDMCRRALVARIEGSR